MIISSDVDGQKANGKIQKTEQEQIKLRKLFLKNVYYRSQYWQQYFQQVKLIVIDWLIDYISDDHWLTIPGIRPKTVSSARQLSS